MREIVGKCRQLVHLQRFHSGGIVRNAKPAVIFLQQAGDAARIVGVGEAGYNERTPQRGPFVVAGTFAVYGDCGAQTGVVGNIGGLTVHNKNIAVFRVFFYQLAGRQPRLMHEDFKGILLVRMPNTPGPPAFKNGGQQLYRKHIRLYRFDILNRLVKEGGIVTLGEVDKQFFFQKERIFVRLKQPC